MLIPITLTKIKQSNHYFAIKKEPNHIRSFEILILNWTILSIESWWLIMYTFFPTRKRTHSGNLYFEPQTLRLNTAQWWHTYTYQLFLLKWLCIKICSHKLLTHWIIRYTNDLIMMLSLSASWKWNLKHLLSFLML